MSMVIKNKARLISVHNVQWGSGYSNHALKAISFHLFVNQFRLEGSQLVSGRIEFVYRNSAHCGSDQ